MSIRIAVADDHPIVLAGIKALLVTMPAVTMVGEARTGPEALSLIARTMPDIAVLDVSMPGLTGLEVAERLAADCPGVKILALTMHEDRSYVQRLIQAGVRGYLLKRSASEELVRAINAIAAEGLYLDPAVAFKALPGSATVDAAAMAESGGDEGLSVRERDTLRLTASGFSNKEIAYRLEISVKTVETYKARAVEKLGLRTRADIVRYGAARGWLADL
jgi:DNA-binding NarL/FixJ family response regulator